MAKSNKVPITVFNQNISRYINSAKKGELIYLTRWRKPVAILIGVDKMNELIGRLLDEADKN